MNMNRYSRWGGAVSMAAVLAGCGGGGDVVNNAFQPGDALTFSVDTGDNGRIERHFVVHGISPAGDLVAQSAPGLLPERFVMLPEATQKSDALDTATLQAFYKQLWQAIQAHRGSGADSAVEIDDFDVDLVSIYRDFQRSGLSLAEYVGFYEQLDQEPFFAQQEMAEEGLLDFLAHTGWSAGDWLQALQTRQWDWPRFLQLMAQRGHNFSDLQALQAAWKEAGIGDFVARYTGSPLLKAASNFNFQTTNKTGTIIKGGEFKDGFSPAIHWEDPGNGAFKSASARCMNHAEVFGRAKVSAAEIYYETHWSSSRSEQNPGLRIISLSFRAPSYPLSAVRSTAPLNPFSFMMAHSVQVRTELVNPENVGSVNAPNIRFQVLAKYSVSKFFNSRHLVTQTTFETGKDTGKEYCTTKTLTTQ